MRDVYIVSAARTPIGRFGGSLASFTSSELGAIALEAAVRRSGIGTDQFDEVILGNVFQAGGKGNPARQAAIKAGLPETLPAITINKQCASGMRSISLAYQQILVGEADAILAGGIESMSNVPHLVLDGRWGKKLGNLTTTDGLLYDGLHCALEGVHMGITAENLAAQYGISREDQDVFAWRSQQKARRAIEEGRFTAEIVPVERTTRKGTHRFDMDEHPQDTSLEELSKLRPVFIAEEGTVTAGNASGLNDGAAAVTVVSGEKVKEWGLATLCVGGGQGTSLIPERV